MLKITIHQDTQRTNVQLEGALTGPWVDELEHHLQTANKPVGLDLARITFMDQRAARLIEDSVSQGAENNRLLAFRSPHAAAVTPDKEEGP